MALAPRSGSSTSGSSLPDSPAPQDKVDLLERASFVRDVTVERTAFSPATYGLEANALVGYAEGTPIAVTYFHQEDGTLARRTQVLDTSSQRHAIHTRYTRIVNFELRFPEPLTWSYEQTLTEGAITGRAYVPPRFNPAMGDLFLYELGPAQFAEFRVTGLQPLSYFSEAIHEITISVLRWATNDTVQQLLDQTARTVHYDKASFLSPTPILLEGDDYKLLQSLRAMRDQLARYYYKTFYVASLGSLFRPDGVYDPYVVKFITAKTSFDVTGARAKQLVPDVDVLYDKTLWGRLMERGDLHPPTGLNGHWARLTRVAAHLDVGITAAVNRAILEPRPLSQGDAQGAASDYALSDAFYTGTLATMTPLELLVWEAITAGRLADPAGFLTAHVNAYRALPRDAQFYVIPLLIHLIDVVLTSVGRP